MVKNLKRLRRQMERDSGKAEAQKYPFIVIEGKIISRSLPSCIYGLKNSDAEVYVVSYEMSN